MLNKKIKIKRYKIDENREINVFRDDLLKGGTKQRAIEVFIKPDINEYIYAGPTEGYAQIALAYACKLNKKKATLFISGKEKSDLTKKAKSLGAKIFFNSNSLKEVQLQAKKYNQKHPKSLLLPFGLDSKLFGDKLTENIKKALPEDMQYPKRIWLVAGSGTLLKSLRKVFPRSKFMVVQVGKKIWPDQMRVKDKLFVSPKKFWEKADPLPPYPSVSTYDAKLWEFVLKYGKNDDYVWNVAKN